MNFDRKNATLRSALWATYGDALGFMTELASSTKAVSSRTGFEKINKLIPWKRGVGGMHGPKVELPLGCYSDDTQLRLATSRSINSEGFFDIEAFATFEMTIWQNFALGAGRGTKAAALSLTKKNKNWFNNFFKSGGINYINCGGNGAAMRVQPHVWAANDLDELSTFIPDVIKNSIVTHGHPRGIIGSVFHAICLSQVLNGRGLSFDSLVENANICNQVSFFIKNDDLIFDYWIPEWEEQSKESFDVAINRVTEELLNDLKTCQKWVEKSDLNYDEMISLLELDKADQRGSGLKTSLAASLLALKLETADIQVILYNIVNTLNTDTDTIATMFGAIAGTLILFFPQENIQDQKYIYDEALRLYNISQGFQADGGFAYSDITTWQAPRANLDYIVKDSTDLFILGFGQLTKLSAEFVDTRNNSIYQWCETRLGFTILIKRRSFDRINQYQSTLELFSVQASNYLTKQAELPFNSSVRVEKRIDISQETHQESLASPREKLRVDLDSLTKMVISSNFDPELIGNAIIELCDSGEYSIEKVVSFSSIIAKAKISRDKKYNQR